MTTPTVTPEIQQQGFTIHVPDAPERLASVINLFRRAGAAYPDHFDLTFPSCPPPPKNLHLATGEVLHIRPNDWLGSGMFQEWLYQERIGHFPQVVYHNKEGQREVEINVTIPTLFHSLMDGVGFKVGESVWWIHGNEGRVLPGVDLVGLRERNQLNGWNPDQDVVEFATEKSREYLKAALEAKDAAEQKLGAIREGLDVLWTGVELYPPDNPDGHTPDTIARHLSAHYSGHIDKQLVLRHAEQAKVHEKGKRGQKVVFNNFEMRRIVTHINQHSSVAKREPTRNAEAFSKVWSLITG